MMGCDAYFTYCGEGNFVPLKHYDPAEEDKLLNKYCPKIAKEKQKKVGGRARKGLKVKGNPLLVMTHSQLELLVVTHSQVLPRRRRVPLDIQRAQGGVTNNCPQRVPTDVALEEVG